MASHIKAPSNLVVINLVLVVTKRKRSFTKPKTKTSKGKKNNARQGNGAGETLQGREGGGNN
jgi:hypothetical protein